MDVSIQQLRMLREVQSQGTIAAAADQLGYTASAVSQQLSAIERVTGVAVLERIGRNVFLTDAGRELVLHATTILDQLEEARAAVERVSGSVTGILRIGVIESVANSILPPLLSKLAKAHPDLDVRTRQADQDAAPKVRSGEIDLAFTVDLAESLTKNDDRIDRILVCRDWFKVVVLDDDELGDSVVNLADLEARRLIASPPELSCGRCLVQACRTAGFEPDYAHQLDDYPTILRLVASGAGVGLVPDLGLRRLPEGIRVAELKDPVSRNVELVWRRSSSDRPAIRAVVDAVVAVAEDMGLDR
ncbi:MAG: LysR substrate-binding domain-containing protein [Acidimicrobiia bacterium]|nr:LysR substrate-binding domain-containing protein [Acidimicrobiia bacterium]